MSVERRSSIEDLANEIWLEMFDYLDWINLFSTFYGLNKRINQLLMCIKILSVYSSYLINQSDRIYLCFKEFPLDEFKQLQHFRLTYDYPYDESLNIAKYFRSFSTLKSFIIDGNYDENCRCTNEFTTIIFRQYCPFLQHLHLHGNVFEQEVQITENICTFNFPFLRHVHVNKLPFHLAIQLLNQCTHLHSFSSILYNYPSEENVVVLPDRIRIGLPLLKKLHLGEDNFYEKETSSTFLELFLPCCPNLCAFNFHIRFNDCYANRDKFLSPNWWKLTLASNNKLNRIFLHLHWWTRDIRNNGFEKIQRFGASPFFIAFNVDIKYEFKSEFMRSLEYDLYIKN
ncbi:hypothetical protein I4U23_004377 [Adineta vaga]|nr:hypothetical protein I4U23_004377 [Adineta vaga]